jgi:hypothetical protein
MWEVWLSNSHQHETPITSLGQRLGTGGALSPNPHQSHHYPYKTPVALRQSSKRTKTRIAKRYCQTQCIALHNDRFATSQLITLLKFSPHLCQRAPIFPFLRSLQPEFCRHFLSQHSSCNSPLPKKDKEIKCKTHHCVIFYTALITPCLHSTSKKAISNVGATLGCACLPYSNTAISTSKSAELSTSSLAFITTGHERHT